MAALAAAVAVLGLPAASEAAARTPAPLPVGKPWRLPVQQTRHSRLAAFGPGRSPARGRMTTAAQAAQTAAASARARATGKPVQVAGLTTETTTVTAEPDGREVARAYVLPVRVHHGRRWVAVNTSLRRVAGGRLAPAAIPGDVVTFSGGGTGPMAVISASGTHLALWWPGRLAAPVVAGPSATYRNVLPGVDLVLTATSAESGGFSEVLVIRTRAAAHDPRLANLALRVTTAGTTGLRTVSGGGLAAAMTGGRGSYVAPPPRMWDSSSVAPRAAAARAASASARRAGAGLAAPGDGPVSTVSGPAGGARLAGVAARVSAGGKLLALAPDERMLASPSTRFPVFIDPSFGQIAGTGHEQAYDPVQSKCPSEHYNSPSYKFSPVGYNDFQTDQCAFTDTDYALYRVAIPSGVFAPNAVLISATFQATEVYTSDCSSSAAMHVSWIGGIGPSTGWPGPAETAGNVDAVTTVGPDPGSCNNVENTSKTVSAGFNIEPDLDNFGGSASAITLRLWEPGSTNDAVHKQFTDNPDLQVVYTDTPNTPSSLEEAANNSGAGSLGCDTSPSNPPRIGKTDSISGVYLLGDYGDNDGAAVQANIRYWNYTTNGPVTTKTDALDGLTTGHEEGWPLPASVTSGLPNGTVVAWQAQAETGSASIGGTVYGPYSSAWSPTCYFAVYPTAPDAPTVTANFDQTKAQPVGSPLKFTITQSSGDTASKFIWALDTTPPTTGTIPAGQTCTTTGPTSGCTQISNGTATLTILVPASGPHDLWVYEQDGGGNDSGMTNDAAPGASSTFSGALDTPVSYISGASLQANFDAALAAGAAYDNTMISTKPGSSGTADGDGGGSTIDEAQLGAAGWTASKTVTVDGATFTLPGFGLASSGPDNLLAANQTIGTGPGGAQGSALVFLATSTAGDVRVGGLATGSPDSGSLSGDATAPAVMGGVPVTGSGCSGAVAFDATTSCDPATGTITYNSSCSQNQAAYTLTVPDWVNGPSGIAALTMPDRDTPTGQQADNPKIYAFAVPLNGSCTVTSVTLPDVTPSVSTAITPGPGGVSQTEPGLHIFGIAVRNNTTATPGATGTATPSPSAQAWTGAFESPIEGAFPPPSGHTWGNQTVRIEVSPNVSAPAGTADVRIKLSDPGFLSADGTGPLKIGAATIAQSYYGAMPGQTPVPLTFGGSGSVTVPEGGDVYSDPLTLPFAVTAGHGLLVSLWLQNPALPVLPLNSFASGSLAWFSPPGTPNETADTTGTPFSGAGGYFIAAVPVLTGLDVTTPEVTSGGVTVSPGEPTVVVAGDNVIDGYTSSAANDALDFPGQRLAGQLASQPGLATGYGVVDAGVQANQVLADGTGGGGVSLLARLDADVLAEPDAGTVVIDEGLEDLLLQAGSATAVNNLKNAYTALEVELTGFGVNVVTADLTPCTGYSNATVKDSCSATVDAARTQVNSFVDSGGASPNCPALFDAAVGNAASPEALAAGNGRTDDVNLTLGASGGYAKLAPAVTAGQACVAALAPNSMPLPPAP